MRSPSIRFNNCRKNVKDPNALPIDNHFTIPGHNFKNNAKFAVIEMLANTN